MMDYLELNRDVLERVKSEEGENSARYRTLVRYLECQNIYERELENGVYHEEEAWTAAARHWNSWAEEMMKERELLERSGEWLADEDWDGRLRGCNKATSEWIKNAFVDFSSSVFLEKDSMCNDIYEKYPMDFVIVCKDANFSRFIFPVFTSFERAFFFGDAKFVDAKFCCGVLFEEDSFLEEVDFSRAVFRGLTNFENARFHADAAFVETRFYGDASFVNAQFDWDPHFTNACFEGYAGFWLARFGAAWFNYAQFKDVAMFDNVRFDGGAGFEHVVFGGVASFKSATFGEKAHFFAMVSRRGFSLVDAHFKQVPDFEFADFREAPVLTNVRIGDQLTGRCGMLRVRCVDEPHENAQDISRKFRILREMAHNGRDWFNEMEFLAQEVRVRRYWLDFPFGPNSGRFWLGLIFEKFSDFGRSLARPMMAWLVLTAGFALLYAWLAVDGPKAVWSALDAIYLSVWHGLVVGRLVCSGHEQAVVGAMFGSNSSGLAALMIVQMLFSAVLWLFFFLALRNHFRGNW